MCLINLAVSYKPDYKLIFIANRDEFLDRPSAPISFWKDKPEILAGKDLKEGGTWMGITRKGLFAAITNYRDLSNIKDDAPSRGIIVSEFLSGSYTPEQFAEQLFLSAEEFNGFNLIFGSINNLYYFSNQNKELTRLEKGIYGLSNHLLDTPWPKVKRSKERFKEIISKEEFSVYELIDLLSDKTIANDQQLPDTGVGIELERVLSPVFIESPKYGTRSMSVVMVDKKDNVTFIERSLDTKKNSWETIFFKMKLDHS